MAVGPWRAVRRATMYCLLSRADTVAARRGPGRPGNGTSKPVPARRGQMRAPGARLRPVPLPARESTNPHASSAHTQRKSISGACSLPSRSLVLARPGLTWTLRRIVSCRISLTFTVVGQDERGQGIDRRGHLFQGTFGQGALLSALSSAVLTDPALGKAPILLLPATAPDNSDSQCRVQFARSRARRHRHHRCCG